MGHTGIANCTPRSDITYCVALVTVSFARSSV